MSLLSDIGGLISSAGTAVNAPNLGIGRATGANGGQTLPGILQGSSAGNTLKNTGKTSPESGDYVAVKAPSSGGSGGSATVTSGGGGTGGAADATTTATNAVISQAQNALNQALSALNSANSSIDASAAGQTAQQKVNYDDTMDTNAQGLVTAEQAAKAGGNNDLTSLERLISGMGGGGSSVETMLVPKLVQNKVQSDISGADTTKATNDQSATTAWNTFLNNLSAQVQNQKATNNAGYQKEVQSLNAAIAAGKAGVLDPTSLDEEVDNVVSSIPNVVSSVAPQVYTPPQLATFQLTPSQIAAAAGTALPTTGASAIPYLASLTQQKQQNGAAPVAPVATVPAPLVPTA